MQLFKSNYSVINAVQVVRFRLQNGDLNNFASTKGLITSHNYHANVKTVDGWVKAELGDWIINTAGKELIVLTNETFRSLFVKLL